MSLLHLSILITSVFVIPIILIQILLVYHNGFVITLCVSESY